MTDSIDGHMCTLTEASCPQDVFVTFNCLDYLISWRPRGNQRPGLFEYNWRRDSTNSV